MDKKNELRTTLIKTGLVLGMIFIFITSALSTTQDIGVWNTLIAGFSGIFSTIKFLVELALGFAVCVFFIALFIILSQAVVSKDNALATFYGLLYKLTSKPCFQEKMQLHKKEAVVKENNDKENEIPAQVAASEIREETDNRIVALKKNQKKLAEQISTIALQVNRCEEKAVEDDPGELLEKIKTDMSSLSEKVEELQKTVEAVPAELLSKMENNISGLPEKVEELQKAVENGPAELLGKMENNMSGLTGKVEELQKAVENGPAELLGKMENNISGLDKKMEEFRKAVGIVQDELSVMRDNTKSMTALETLPEKPDEEKQEQEEDEHRIFTYIEDIENRDAFIKHVKETVEQGLSYAKAMAYIAENSSKTVAEIITSHPSLTRDYIKMCRQP